MEGQIALRGVPNAPAINLNVEDVKKYIAPNATDKELFMFMEIAKSYGLNPFKREVYFVKYGDSPGATIVGYEMYIKRAEGTERLDGWGVELGKDDLGEFAQITIHRKDRSKPFVWTVYRDEFDTKKANWQKMPKFMLRKVAISQGFRLAFPEDLGGMPYIPEEINGHTSEDLPKGDVIEGEVMPDGFKAPEGMDQLPDGPLPIDPAKLTGFLASIDSLDELKSEWDNTELQERLAVSDKKAVKRAFDTRIAQLTQREAA